LENYSIKQFEKKTKNCDYINLETEMIILENLLDNLLWEVFETLKWRVMVGGQYFVATIVKSAL
jgi:hypothetical protein